MPVTASGNGVVIHVDAHQIGLLRQAFIALAVNEQGRIRRAAVNRAGDMAYTRVVATLASETGAANREVRKEVSKHRAVNHDAIYRIVARGGYWPLKRFRPKQGKAGVSASPWNVKRVFKGTFFGPNAHVYRRTSKKRFPIEKLWGPAIPKEMVRGRTAEVANEVVADELPKRLIHETDRAIARVKAKYGL